MKLFAPLYDRALAWAGHRHAVRYLSGLSFAESTFFPVPPDVMLAPMVLADRDKSWLYAAICTVSSVIGGLFGYLLGAFAFEWIEPLLHQSGYWPAFERAQEYFDRWGFWFILLAGFSPIPYKVFTISAGVIGMPLLPFVTGSVVGRGGRFFLVAGLIRVGGERMAQSIRRNIEWLGWVAVVLILGVIAFLQLR
jgi:membrane protein YqaA with SNARE-associated domain